MRLEVKYSNAVYANKKNTMKEITESTTAQFKRLFHNNWSVGYLQRPPVNWQVHLQDRLPEQKGKQEPDQGNRNNNHCKTIR